MKFLFFTGVVLTQIVAAAELCDSNTNQRCSDGTECRAEILDCTKGLDRCICGSQNTRAQTSAKFCDSTVPNQFCQDGTPCSQSLLECLSPRRCKCGTLKQPQEEVAPAWTAPPTHGQPSWQPVQALPKPSWQPAQASPSKTKNVYCNPKNPGERCKDGTPCSANYLDCVTKGPDRCICPAADAGLMGATTTPDRGGLMGLERAGLMDVFERAGLMEEEDATDYRWGWDANDSDEMPVSRDDSPMLRGGGMSRKTKRVYCDGTAAKRQTCKDGTPCSPKFLDCHTKGLNRCICPNGNEMFTPTEQWQQPSSTGEDMHMFMPEEDTWQQQRPSMSGSYEGKGQQQWRPASKPGYYFDESPSQDSYDETIESGSGGQFLDQLFQKDYDGEQVSPGEFTTPGGTGYVQQTLQGGSYEGLSKKKNVYCNPKNSGERCKDGTPCSAKYLDCVTKGPDRCICPAPSSSGDSNFMDAMRPAQAPWGLGRGGMQQLQQSKQQQQQQRPTFPRSGMSSGPKLTARQQWSLQQWLEENNISEFEETFLKEQLTTRAALSKLTEEQLKQLGMSAMGLRNRVLDAVEKFDSGAEDAGMEIPVAVPPSEWQGVVQRMAPFYPDLSMATLGSAVIASRGDATKASKLIKRTTGMEPQEYTEQVDVVDVFSGPLGQIPMPQFQRPALGSFYPTPPQSQGGFDPLNMMGGNAMLEGGNRQRNAGNR